jgi:hypothetical protein
VRISQPPTTSSLIADADIDMLTLYQLKRLAAPASGEALRKGNPDITNTEVDDAAAIAYWKLALTGGITNDDIASDAAIAVSKLASTPILESLLTTRGDIIYRGASAAERLAKGTAGQYLQQGANDPQWASVAAGPTIVRKTADETVNNSATLQNDDDLLLAIAANEVWLVELYLLQKSPSTTADFKMGWAYPAGCSIYWGVPNLNTTYGTGGQYWLTVVAAGTIGAILTEASTLAAASLNGTQGIHITAIVINGATAGTLNFQWAQNTATAEDTKVLANSCLIAHKLG